MLRVQFVAQPLAIIFYCIAILLITPLIIAGLVIIYDRLGTYHYLINSKNPDIPTESGESFADKVILVFIFNLSIVMLTTLFVTIYQFDNIETTPAFIFAVGSITVLLHSSMRLVSLIDWGYFSKTEKIINTKERVMSFGLSLTASIYALSIISVGLNLVMIDFESVYSYSGGELNVLATLGYIAGTFVIIGGLSILTEYILAKSKIHDCLKTERQN